MKKEEDMKNKIFLAGASGMLGSQILKELLFDNNSTINIMRHNSDIPLDRYMISSADMNIFNGNLFNKSDCALAMNECNTVIMAAADSGGAAYIRDNPWQHMENNLIMNLNILDVAKTTAKKIIYISSSTAYQEFDGYIKEEDMDLNKEPNEAYFGFGHATRFIEKMCLLLNKSYKKDILILRASNIYGPYDKFKPEVSHFIPALIKKACDRTDPFIVWGSPLVQRDVVFSEDFAKIVVKLMKLDFSFDCINVGSGQSVSVRDVVDIILKQTGHNPEIVHYDQSKPSTLKFRALDCSKLKNKIDIKYTSLDDGIEKTVKWWEENKNKWNR